MPNYYNPYNFYPASYMQNMYPQMQQPVQQSFAQAPQQGPKMMEWVEGEVGAKAFQMPMGWPANSPIPLWDSTDTVIYLKSWGPMGIPNPMQKLRYEMPEQRNLQRGIRERVFRSHEPGTGRQFRPRADNALSAAPVVKIRDGAVTVRSRFLL